jgi:hypothetical protein
MAKAKKPIQLKFVFDTNVIYVGTSMELVKKEISDFIAKYDQIRDIEISWVLPETVINERTFQMRKIGYDLLPSIQKVEKLIGINLNITRQILEKNIDDLIRDKIIKQPFEVATLDTALVDWSVLVQNACYRLPPFSDTEKEKGFRDALVLECVKQLVQRSPKSTSLCRIIFISGDKLLGQAAEQAINQSNYHSYESIADAENLINVLTAQMNEAFIKDILLKASEMFFIKKDEETLYYKEKVGQKINQDFGAKLLPLPLNADSKTVTQILIKNPVFERKTGQRIIFKSTIEHHAQFTKTVVTGAAGIAYTSGTGISGLSSGTIGSQGISSLFSGKAISGIGGLVGGTSLSGWNNPSETSTVSTQIVATGFATIDVIWSGSVTTANKLKQPKIEDISFAGNTITPS